MVRIVEREIEYAGEGTSLRILKYNQMMILEDVDLNAFYIVDFFVSGSKNF